MADSDFGMTGGAPTVGGSNLEVVGDSALIGTINFGPPYCWICGNWHEGCCGPYQPFPTHIVVAPTLCSGQVHVFACEHVTTCQCGATTRGISKA